MRACLPMNNMAVAENPFLKYIQFEPIYEAQISSVSFFF